MNRHVKRIIVFFIAISLVVSCFQPINTFAKTSAPKDVKASSIKYVSMTDDNVFTFKWKKVSGVDGYLVRLIDYDSYDYNDVIRVLAKGWSSKAKIKIEAPEDCHFYIQVRSYKYDESHRKVYGKWVMGGKDFYSMIAYNPY